MFDAYMGTTGGAFRLRDGALEPLGLERERVSAIHVWREGDATTVLAGRPDLVLAGPAPHVGRGGRIVVSADGGDSWEPAGEGVDMPMPDMVELFVAAPDAGIWAICSGGRLLRAVAGDWSWSSALPAGAQLTVEALAFLPANDATAEILRGRAQRW